MDQPLFREAPVSNASPAKPTPVKGLLILGAVVVVMGLFFTLGQVLGVTQLWAAFMFLMFWGNEKLQFEKLSACVLGALTGLVVAYIAHELPPALGPAAGVALLLGVIAVMVYCAIMGWLTVAINTTCWAYLTVGTIPAIQAQAEFPGLFAALALGVVYFAGLAWFAQLFVQRAAAKAART
jgi:hypothetical protein